MSRRALRRVGVVRAVSDDSASIAVTAPCTSCSQAGCTGRRANGEIQLPARGLREGDHVRLLLAARSLTSASLAVFGPPLAWLAGSGLLLALAPGLGSQPFGPALVGCGMVGAVAVGVWLGRRAAASLTPQQQLIDGPPVTDAGLASGRQ